MLRSENALSRNLRGRREAVCAVHSISRFVFSVPDLEEARRFYTEFGLDTRRVGDRLDLYAHGHAHCWAQIYATGQAKTLEYLALGIYERDLEVMRARIDRHQIDCQAHPMSDGGGLWLNSPDGVPIQLLVCPKVSPDAKSPQAPATVSLAGPAAASSRRMPQPTRPRHLSHIALFTRDVERMVRFSTDILGLRLSDQSGDVMAFVHTPHGGEHHLLAFAKSSAPGLHHSGWDVGSIDEVGQGAMQMRLQGYGRGWGLGRHQLGSNYFHYVRDPWGSFAEYSFDIDFVPAGSPRPASVHPAEDSLCAWGPEVPDDFDKNHETPWRDH